MDEKLEQTVRQIFRNVCNHEERDSQASAITGERILGLERFRRRNTRFARAQKVLIQELRTISSNRRQLESALKEARRTHDKTAVASLNRDLRLEDFKERLFRSLADCIAWQLIDGRVDIARHLDISQPTRPNLDSSNFPSVAKAADELNQKNPLSFALMSDLTSFVQIGDLLRKDLNNPILSIIEVKDGEKNVQAFELLEKQPAGSLNLDEIASTHGEKLMKQVRRILRQKITGDKATQIINTGRGADPVSGMPVMISDPHFRTSNYNHLLAQLLTELDDRIWSYGIVERAVLVGCYTGPMKKASYGAIRTIAEQEFKENFLIVNLGQSLFTSLTEPIFLKPFREKDIFDIVFDRTRVHIAIGLDLILEMFKVQGLSARWLSKRETAKLQARPEEVKLHANRAYRLLTVAGRAMAISSDDYELYLGDALVTRIAFENLRPSSVVRMFSQTLADPTIGL